MPIPRSSGLLLHVTSLPGPHGIGDLGPAAFAWVEFLARAKQSWWQILPLGPTGYGDSPYQCFSAFAGNPLLISPNQLIRDGLLTTGDLENIEFPADRVDFEQVLPYKHRLLDRAWSNFQAARPRETVQEFEKFRSLRHDWLDDFALFMAIKENLANVSWQDWPKERRMRYDDVIADFRREHADAIGRQMFGQFLFSRQWSELKAYANARGVSLIGDMPIFVATDSADVWSKPDLFQLDENRRPRKVAGVPPDYFAATGQLWGNPQYDWPTHQRSGYAWWIARLRSSLELVDLLRLDHFRGFEAAWEIPAGDPTAQNGRWMPGPGIEFFKAVRHALGGLPLIAEDLGLITPDVETLRTDLGLPGMRILQFAFGGALEDRFLPHRFDRNSVVYTGTHDNDTTAGWYHSLTTEEHRRFRRYVPGVDASWDLIRLAWASVADLAIAPLQDVLGLGKQARMNVPGQPSGNWRWRFAADALTDEIVDRIAELTETYERHSPIAAGRGADSS